MKLKDIDKMIESQNKFNEFMGSIERKVIILDELHSRNIKFNNIKELIKYFNKEFYGELTKDTELYNDNGYIKFDVEYLMNDWNGKEFVKVTEKATYNIYIDEIQVWN